MRYHTCPSQGSGPAKTLDMFEKIGIRCEIVRQKIPRKLIFT